MSRRGTNTILMKRCDSPLIVGQQMETRPSSEYGGTRGLAERRLVRDGRKNSQKARNYKWLRAQQARGGNWASRLQIPAFQEILCVTKLMKTETCRKWTRF